MKHLRGAGYIVVQIYNQASSRNLHWSEDTSLTELPLNAIDRRWVTESEYRQSEGRANGMCDYVWHTWTKETDSAI
jgi:hypothetical protein